MLELYESIKSLTKSNLDYSQMILEMPLKQLISTLKEKVKSITIIGVRIIKADAT